MGDALIVCGGVIPEKDYDLLYSAGVSAIFGPGTQIPKAALEMIALLRERGVSSYPPPGVYAPFALPPL